MRDYLQGYKDDLREEYPTYDELLERAAEMALQLDDIWADCDI